MRERHRAYKFRIYPTEEQIKFFINMFGSCRFIWNVMLEDKINYYKENHSSLNNTPAQYKEKFNWLKEMDAYALCNEQLNLQRAFSNFFRDPKFGFPKFKSKKNNKQSYTTSCVNNNIRITQDSKYIKLPKAGEVKIKIHRGLPKMSKIKSCTISKTPSEEFYASILCTENDSSTVEFTGAMVGIDLGIKDFLITSDETKISNPKYYQNSLNKLAKLQRRLSRKPKDSKNREKARIKVAKLSKHVSNQREDFQHKLSRELVNTYDVICCEDLNIKGMIRNHKLAKQIQDVGWSSFITKLQYKCGWEGKKLIKINKWFPSSKTCSCCGYVKEDLTLDIRSWTCPDCNTKHDRDINAAKNILKEGLKADLNI